MNNEIDMMRPCWPPLSRFRRFQRWYYKWPFHDFYKAYRDWQATGWNVPTWQVKPLVVLKQSASQRKVRREGELLWFDFYAKHNYRRAALLLPVLILLAEVL